MIPSRLFWFFDAAVFLLAFSIAYQISPEISALLGPDGSLGFAFLWMRPPWPGPLPPAMDHLWILLTVGLCGLALLSVFGAHRSLLEQSPARIALTCIAAPLAALSLITLVLFALKSPDWSRVFIFTFVGLSAAGLIVYRFLLRAYCLRRLHSGAYARNLLLIGSAEDVLQLEERIAAAAPPGHCRIVGYLRTEEGAASPVRTDLPCLGTVEQLDTYLIRHPIGEVIVAQPAENGSWVSQVISGCDQVSVPLRLVPVSILRDRLETLQPQYPPPLLRLPAVVLTPPHVETEARFVKRVLDVSISGLLLLLLSPLLAIIALMVKLSSPGPVLYRWHVIGRHGYEFTGFKFRTMVRDADARRADLITRNEMSGPVFKISNDPRITNIGRFLRKYSLDELPQLWSVLKGDMSLVGPRPAFRSELDRYEFWQMRKLSTRPGITCLWQVRGRNQIKDFNEWVKLDLEYIDNWSLWLDC
jgi:exopolysaccharide biosynthesis polyprenyl glycosylphosphotransferase